MADVLTYQVLLDRFATAGEALLANRGVVVDADGIATYPASAGDRISGIILVGAAAGEPIRVVTDGIVPAKLAVAAGVVKGTKLYANTTGQFTPTGTAGFEQSATAEMAGGANGNLIKVRISDLIDYTVPGE
jgi:hypothetical protein